MTTRGTVTARKALPQPMQGVRECRQDSIPQRVEELFSALAGMAKTVEELRGRLDPVLRGGNPSCADGTSEPRAAGSSIRERLRDAIEHTDHMRAEIHDLIVRLDV